MWEILGGVIQVDPSESTCQDKLCAKTTSSTTLNSIKNDMNALSISKTLEIQNIELAMPMQQISNKKRPIRGEN